MKKGLSTLLLLALLLSCMAMGYASSTMTAAELKTAMNLAVADLDPNNKCPLTPMVYCSPRYKDADKDSAYELRRGLSASQINEGNTTRSYGLYFKFTPRGRYQSYTINRIDFTIHDKKGDLLYVDGFDTSMQCQSGYYWYWNFFPLEGLYDNMRILNGSVTAGSYTMNIYFNKLWAGKTSFSIKK